MAITGSNAKIAGGKPYPQYHNLVRQADRIGDMALRIFGVGLFYAGILSELAVAACSGYDADNHLTISREPELLC